MNDLIVVLLAVGGYIMAWVSASFILREKCNIVKSVKILISAFIVELVAVSYYLF
jgi:hypothetical protein